MNMKKIILVVIFVLIVLLLSFYFFTYKSKPVSSAVCGNGICELTEDCNTCPEDCGCLEGQYCSHNGICKEHVCGDGLCLESELFTCCIDCGCLEGFICNRVTQLCVEKLKISKEELNKIAEDYMVEKNIAGRVAVIKDSYYQENAIKIISIDVTYPGFEFTRRIDLFIDENKNIVEEYIAT